MNDLVQRLNVMSFGICGEAADRIEALEAALTELVTACEENFVNDEEYPDEANVCRNEPDGYGLMFGHIRRAWKALRIDK